MRWPRRASLKPRTITRRSRRPPRTQRTSSKAAYTTAAKGTADYNRKVIEIAGANAHAALDYAHELLGVKSPSEFIELSTAHARKQFEAMAAQTKELTELAQKVTTEIAANEWRTGDTKKSKRVA